MRLLYQCPHWKQPGGCGGGKRNGPSGVQPPSALARTRVGVLAMATVSAKRPRVKPARSVRLARRPSEGAPGILDITVRDVQTSYFLFPIASDFGTAFRLEKFKTQGGGIYHVLL